MLTAILIDDEKSSLESLKIEIEAYCPEVRILHTFNDPKDALNMITSANNDSLDLVFLDIEMPGMNGFEMLQQIDNIYFDVIFITAYDQFAIQAFEFNAVDYLLKPIMKSKLVAAVDKVIGKKVHQFPKDNIEALLTNIKVYSNQGFEKIALPTSEGFEFVHMNDIIYLKGESNYTWAFLESGKKYLISKTLKDLSAIIHFPQFYRAHKSYLVNLNHALKYIRGSGGYLIMKGNVQVPVSRTQKAGLMLKLKI